MRAHLKFFAFSKTYPGARVCILTIGLWLALHGYEDARAQRSLIRLAVVNTPSELLLDLLPGFENNAGYRADIVFVGEGVYDQARAGAADLVISHYGHPGVEPFVTEGLGLWPHTVFANQAVLVGPRRDPARIRGLTNAAEGFRRIAETESPFLVNNNSGIKYLEEVMWEGAGRPALGEWYVDLGLQQREAVEAAAARGAYVLWGLIPFLRLQAERDLDLHPMVLSDPLLQRVMVSVVVNPERIPGVNYEGAAAFQSYLITPATQARILAFRNPGFDSPLWWPYGRHNSAAGRE